MPISEEDRKLFRTAVKGTRRLSQTRSFQFKRTPAPQHLRSHETDEYPQGTTPLSDPTAVSDIDPGEKIAYSKPNIPPRTLRKLRRGQLDQDSIIDLHGKRVDEARNIIETFLTYYAPPPTSCVRVIHGKGLGSNKGPVLKKMLYHWLPQHPRVLAFCSAQPADGGTGAIYLLLKRKQ